MLKKKGFIVVQHKLKKTSPCSYVERIICVVIRIINDNSAEFPDCIIYFQLC